MSTWFNTSCLDESCFTATYIYHSTECRLFYLFIFYFNFPINLYQSLSDKNIRVAAG